MSIYAYCYQMYHLLVYNTSNQVCHNCILIIHAFSRICTIILQLLYNLPINSNVCFLIIAFKLYIPYVAYIPLALQRHGNIVKSRIRRYALLKATRNLLKVDFKTLSIDSSSKTTCKNS